MKLWMPLETYAKKLELNTSLQQKKAHTHAPVEKDSKLRRVAEYASEIM